MIFSGNCYKLEINAGSVDEKNGDVDRSESESELTAAEPLSIEPSSGRLTLDIMHSIDNSSLKHMAQYLRNGAINGAHMLCNRHFRLMQSGYVVGRPNRAIPDGILF